MALLRPFSDRTGSYGTQGRRDHMVRRFGRRARGVTAMACAPLLAGAQFLVPVVVGAGVTATTLVHAAPARASSGSVLVLSTSVNGGSSSPEAQAVPSGYTVTVASDRVRCKAPQGQTRQLPQTWRPGLICDTRCRRATFKTTVE